MDFIPQETTAHNTCSIELDIGSLETCQKAHLKSVSILAQIQPSNISNHATLSRAQQEKNLGGKIIAKVNVHSKCRAMPAFLSLEA